MKSKRLFKSILAKCLVLAISMSLVPGNVWAQSLKRPMIKHQEQSTASDADEFIGEEDELEITDDDDIATDSDALATDSDAKGKIPVENLALFTVPVLDEEVTLDGREFSTIVLIAETPNYHVIKYTVPQGRGGHYSVIGKYVDSSYSSIGRYFCNEEQYEAMSHKIEANGYPVYPSVPTESLAFERYSTLTYQLKEGQDYYIISAWSTYDSNEAFNLVLTREIDVKLDSSGATSAGTPALYSKGGEWCDFSSRQSYDVERSIIRPEKSGYRFDGYYTEMNGQGTQVIDDSGEILPAMNELAEDCTVYAGWTQFSPVSYQEIKLEGRRFSTIVSSGASPYYHVFKYTVPEGGSGSYSFYYSYIGNDIAISGYICTPEQYELLCQKIEQDKKSVWSWGAGFYLRYDNNRFSLDYNLEAGKDYYFVAARYYDDEEGDYRAVFERDITVTFAAPDADQPGTTGVYSEGGKWLQLGSYSWGRKEINRPVRDGYKFAGYFTEENGRGIRVIDYDGEILDALGELDTDTTVYAHWEDFSPVTYEEILLSDGRFSTTGVAEQAPYYKVLKFKVPENGTGYYSFYYSCDNYVDMAGYMCTPAQYEALCRKIEADGSIPGDLNRPGDYIKFSSILNLTYLLESGQDYYFVATRYSKNDDGEGEYQLLFRRDIEVKLDAGEANYQGTSMLYSCGNQWSEDDDRWSDTYQIINPRRKGYLFAGYFTEKDGQGKRVIDQDSYIYEEDMYEFTENTTIYALWEDKNLEFKTDHLRDGTRGVSYSQQLAIASKMNFYWWVSEGELPEGLYLDLFEGCIMGRPTEAGTKTIVITARNSKIRLRKEFTITINEPKHSDSDEESPGNWIMDETGNWRFYSGGSNYYSNEWKYLDYNGTSHWYHFGSDGHVSTGWFADNTGKWYYLNPVSNGTKGAMQTGWLTDPLDGNRYYLDPTSGQMQTGWVLIDNVWYYFNENSSTNSGWKWDESFAGWNYQNLGQKPMGMLEADRKRAY